MCGLCNFGCCNHQNFHVEITEEEQEKYRKEFGLDLELEWPQDGCCDLLSEDGSGCSLGNERPIFCKTYPLVETDSFDDYDKIYFIGDRCERNGNDYELYQHYRTEAYKTTSTDHTIEIVNKILSSDV